MYYAPPKTYLKAISSLPKFMRLTPFFHNNHVVHPDDFEQVIAVIDILLGGGGKGFILDFDRVGHLAAFVPSRLIEIQSQLRKKNIPLIVCSLHLQPASVFSHIDSQKALTVYPTFRLALAGLTAPARLPV